MRGSAEPDLSKARAKGYDTFIRKLEAYVADFGDGEHNIPLNLSRETLIVTFLVRV
jgi:hypothetical protein